jgi:hypothetical protein
MNVEVKTMRKLLAFLAGAIFALASGYARADYSSTDTQDTDKVMRDDDHSPVESGQEQSTVIRMPGEPGVEGSGAGGAARGADMDKSGSKPEEQTSSEPDPYRDRPGYLF